MSAASRAASVAAHYNQRQQGSASDRKRSEVFHLRQFNNWVKATLLAHYGGKVRVHTWAGVRKARGDREYLGVWCRGDLVQMGWRLCLTLRVARAVT